MRVLDLFSGFKGFSQAFEDRGHEVLTVDIDPRFEPDIIADVMELSPEDLPTFDAILASPPCDTFSTMQMGSHWNCDGTPKTKKAEISMAVVFKTKEFISRLDPRFFVIENPRARLRTLGFLNEYPRITISYCRYGEKRMKPTDLWGRFPASWNPRSMCHNGNPDHISSPRGSTTGTQSRNSKSYAKVPYELSLEICKAMEADIYL